ncbi:type VI secretion system tip protein TssI/VgrG [Pseudomonas sp. MDT2-39-1]
MFGSANTAHFALHIPAVRNDFKVLAFDGVEAISALYAIQVELVSEHPDFDLESLLSQPAFLQFGFNGEGLHGRIEDVFVGEAGKRLTRYHLTLVPALHYLQFSHNQRIFQNLTVPQIIAQVLKGHGVQADAFTFHVSTSPERKYCTQYGENDFEFVQRLCAEDGIAWHHQHSADGHLLVFTDDQTWFPKLGETPYLQDSGMVADHPVVSQFSMRFSTRTSTVTRRGYDLKRPSLLLESRFTAEFSPELEDYRYPVLMKSENLGKQLARQALERHRTDYQLTEGKSDQPTLRCGHYFDLTEHPRKTCNDLWLLLSVTHAGKQPQSLEEAITSDVKPEDGFTQGYRNSFSAIPWDVFYRPPMRSRKTVLVSQTARVTGPVGEEIYCDEYGRVRVELPWDRAELDSEKSSCWLRVSSSWAGESFGAVTIPRIGMEVVVTYLEGNPDQPLITGCVANKVTSVPYTLPEHKTKTVLRSHSSPHTGGYNELSLEDRAGQEQIYLRAQRDLEQLILNDSDTKIGNDRREQITRDSHSLISNDRFEQVDNHSASLIKGDELHTTQGVRNTVIGGNELITITGNSSTTAGGTLVIQAGSQAHVTAANVVIDAGMSLTLKAGGHHIVINAGGIFSSVAIVEGGSPLAGLPGQAALSVVPQAAEAVVIDTLPMEALLKQNIVFREADSGICPVCDAAQEHQVTERAEV